MKKIFSLILCFCMSICAFSLTSYALDNTNSEIELYYLYTDTVTTNVSISGKTVSYNCRVKGDDCTKISIYLYLQEYKNGTWTNIDSVSKSVNSTTNYVSDTYSSAVSGHKYRTEAHIYVYNGSKYEYIEAFSASKTCP